MVKIKDIYILPKWLLLTVVIFLVGVVVSIGILSFYEISYKNKIYAGLSVGDLYLGGKTKIQATALLQAKIDDLSKRGIEFIYKDNQIIIRSVVSTGSEAGIAYELWSYDLEKIVDDLYNIGRSGKLIEDINTQMKLLFLPEGQKVFFKINEKELHKILISYFGRFEVLGRDASFVWKDERLEVEEETSGLIFNYKKIINDIKNNLSTINYQKIELNLVVYEPKITKEQSEFLIPQARKVLKQVPITLFFKQPDSYNGKKKIIRTKWVIDKDLLSSWLSLKLVDNNIKLGLDDKLVGEYLVKIKQIIDTPANNAKFEIKDGRVVEWQSSIDGFILNVPATINLIEESIIYGDENSIELPLVIDRSKITNENVNNLGIKELIGVGKSNFAGSPKNRRHNIAIGAKTLNGLLIKPGEEFSLMNTLGGIDAKSGYKPELVIKGGETIPEYGGGLCQIGTTLFRSVLNSGLKITQRKNHSYRVSYYEPTGTDATIYDPWPDFKFVNDTENYLLLQTYLNGDEAIFEFWGTSDGRQVATTTPEVYNIVKPLEPEYIETDTLLPGEKKKIESAHNGADAYFIRTIIWPENMGRNKIEETWYSHYIPWREKWLIGKTSTTTDIN